MELPYALLLALLTLAVGGGAGFVGARLLDRPRFSRLQFQLDDMTLLKRLVMVVDDGVIVRVFYPVFPPDRSAEEVIAWLQSGASS